MTNHTPGQWVLTTGSDDERIVTSTWDADGLDDDVALVYGGNDDDPVTREANAHLIAAAPDLLAALELALYDFDTWGEVWQSDDDDGVNFPAINAARAAIAKARGEG